MFLTFSHIRRQTCSLMYCPKVRYCMFSFIPSHVSVCEVLHKKIICICVSCKKINFKKNLMGKEGYLTEENIEGIISLFKVPLCYYNFFIFTLIFSSAYLLLMWEFLNFELILMKQDKKKFYTIIILSIIKFMR